MATQQERFETTKSRLAELASQREEIDTEIGKLMWGTAFSCANGRGGKVHAGVIGYGGQKNMRAICSPRSALLELREGDVTCEKCIRKMA